MKYHSDVNTRLCSKCGFTWQPIDYEEGSRLSARWRDPTSDGNQEYVRQVWCATCGTYLGMEVGTYSYSKDPAIPYWSEYDERTPVMSVYQPSKDLFPYDDAPDELEE